MPRTNVPLTTPIGSYPVLPLVANSADGVQTAADVTNHNQIAFGSAARLLVIIVNSGAAAYTFDVTSAPDSFNRKGDITAYSLDADEIAPLIFARDGWRQDDGNLYVGANNAAVKFIAIQL